MLRPESYSDGYDKALCYASARPYVYQMVEINDLFIF